MTKRYKIEAPNMADKFICGVVLTVFMISIETYVHGLITLQYNVFEELPQGTLVGDLRRDSNLTSSSNDPSSLRFEFRLTAVNHLSQSSTSSASSSYSYFTLDQGTGMLRLAQSIDRETICPYSPSCSLSLDIVVHPRHRYVGGIKVVVNVLDLNDNAPSFPPPARVRIVVPRASPVGTEFGLPAAEDRDGGELGVQSYKLTGAGVETGEDFVNGQFMLQVTELFDGSRDVRLKLLKTMDVDDQSSTKDGRLLLVTAADGGSPPRTATLVVDVIVVADIGSVGDGSSVGAVPPRFENVTYETAIMENSPRDTTVVRIRALPHLQPTHLSDMTSSHRVLYKFTESTERMFGNIFKLNDMSGDVYIIGDVDRERNDLVQLTVTAKTISTSSRTGGGGMPGGGAEGGGNDGAPVAFARVLIHILDENDNRPVIAVNVLDCAVEPCQQTQVKENSAPGTFVALVKATDADLGENGRVECIARDDGILRGRRRRLAPPDTGGGVSFRLTPLHGGSSSEYKLTTAVVLDRESRDQYVVTITCTDLASDSSLSSSSSSLRLTSTTTLIVTVSDENDNPPSFTASLYVVRVTENTSPSTLLLAGLNVTDSDIGDNAIVTYSLRPVRPPAVGGGTGGMPSPLEVGVGEVLTIDPLTGDVWTAAELDYETTKEYYFVVTAVDQGSPPRSATARLRLEITDDPNEEEEIRFARSAYYFTMPENSAVGALVGRLSAALHTADVSKDRTLVYSLDESIVGGVPSPFEIDSTTGEIRAIRPLDREDIPVHVFMVSAVLQNSFLLPPLKARVNVTVYVADVNDNRPKIDVSKMQPRVIKLSHDAPAGTFVALIEAWDADIGQNAALVFSIAAGDDRKEFNIDEDTGVVTLARSSLSGRDGDARGEGTGGFVDGTGAIELAEKREDANDEEGNVKDGKIVKRLYTLTIIVTDKGDPPLKSVVQLTVERELPPIETPDPLLLPAVGQLAETQHAGLDLFQGSNLIILIGSVAGLVLVLTTTLIIVIVCHRRRMSRRAHDNYLKDGALQGGGRASLRGSMSSVRWRGGASDGMGEDDVTLAGIYAEMTRSMEMARSAYQLSLEVSRSRANLVERCPSVVSSTRDGDGGVCRQHGGGTTTFCGGDVSDVMNDSMLNDELVPLQQDCCGRAPGVIVSSRSSGRPRRNTLANRSSGDRTMYQGGYNHRQCRCHQSQPYLHHCSSFVGGGGSTSGGRKDDITPRQRRSLSSARMDCGGQGGAGGGGGEGGRDRGGRCQVARLSGGEESEKERRRGGACRRSWHYVDRDSEESLATTSVYTDSGQGHSGEEEEGRRKPLALPPPPPPPPVNDPSTVQGVHEGPEDKPLPVPPSSGRQSVNGSTTIGGRIHPAGVNGVPSGNAGVPAWNNEEKKNREGERRPTDDNIIFKTTIIES